MPGAPVVPAGQPREPRRYFHAVAVDFDGTLALDGRVEADTRGAIDEARDKGVRVVVVTGRILDELRGVVEDLEDFSDAVVAENGCVVWMPGRNWSAAKPIDGRLGEALTSAHINFRRGEVILACSGEDEPQVLAEVRSLGLDCQLVRNRSELMVLPAGVTKATGLLEVLTELGVSPHNTIAIGDAENDAPMLESCELAVAVANAIDALKARADIVLPEPNGLGVASFLRGPILAAPEAPSSARLELTLGVDEDGAAVRLPASRLNVAILGASGEGKSYVAGLVAEQLVGLRYSLLVIDPEGDFLGLADLPGVVMIEGAHSLPSPEVALRPFAHSDLSIVIDLTGIDASRRDAYVAGLRHQVSDLRARTGRPHWVVVDEAQDALGIEESPSGWGLSAGETGHCLVTWKSEVLPLTVVGAIDAVVLVGREPAPAAVHFAAQATGHPETELEERFPLRPGHALLARRAADAPLTTLSIAARRIPDTSTSTRARAWGAIGASTSVATTRP